MGERGVSLSGGQRARVNLARYVDNAILWSTAVSEIPFRNSVLTLSLFLSKWIKSVYKRILSICTVIDFCWKLVIISKARKIEQFFFCARKKCSCVGPTLSPQAIAH